MCGASYTTAVLGASGSGKVGPTRAGLGQFNCVNGRHLSSHQEEEAGFIQGRVGKRGDTGGSWRVVLLHAFPAAALHEGPTAPAH